MNVYATLFNTSGLSIQVSVSPRILANARDRNTDDPVIRRHKSKKGTMSLVFDPTIALIVQGKNRDNSIVFQIRYVYQILSTLTKVYEAMISKNEMYIKAGGALTIDKVAAETCSKKIASFSNSLMIRPTVVDDESGGVRGLEFLTSAGHMASVSHVDARLLIESLEHFDACTYTILMGLVDELQQLNAKLDIMQAGIDDLRQDVKRLVENNQSSVDSDRSPPKFENGMMNWRSANRSLF